MSWAALPVPACLTGDSPFWHPDQSALYWCDVAGKSLHRWLPASANHVRWSLETEPAGAAPLPGRDILLAMRDGLYRFDPESGRRRRLAAPPGDGREQRFIAGKADPQGRYWVATRFEPPAATEGALYRYAAGRLDRMAGGVAAGSGLGFSPDGRTLYWGDGSAHRVDAFDFDGSDGSLSRRRVFVQFAPRQTDEDLARYGGRPDGAAVDVEGAYWCAMHEGQRLLRIGADGRLLQALPLPVRCPTMPCFGGPDLRTLFVTTARDRWPADELDAQPWAGCVLTTRVEVQGLPVHFARG